MSKVIVRNGNVDGALRTMKQKNARDGLLKKVRERQEGYKKPGVKRREKRDEGIKNTRRRERIGTGIVFLLGVIDGYVRPLKCN